MSALRCCLLLGLLACGKSGDTGGGNTNTTAAKAQDCIDENGRDATGEASAGPAADDCNDTDGLSADDCDRTQWITLASALCIANVADVLVSQLEMHDDLPCWYLELNGKYWYIDARTGAILETGDVVSTETG